MENVPAFIDILPQEQVAQLRVFLKSKGADISEENAGDSVDDVMQVIEATEVLWREGKEGGTDLEIDGVYHNIIYLLLIIPSDQNQGLISAFCDKLASGDLEDSSRNAIKMKLLNGLFRGLSEYASHRYIVYMSILRLAAKANMMQELSPDITEIKRWFANWDINTIRVQALWRALYEAFHETKQTEKATKVMVELLGTYTSDNASQAREDAHKCIVTCLADPETFLMDHLLALKPVKFLEGELIHNLLTIFVSGKLLHYVQFYEENREFINSLGLSHEANLHKMKLLTFMQMAEGQKEVEFDTLQHELMLSSEDVEPFVIDVVRTKAVFAKIDQIQRKVILSTTTHRTFGKQQWQLLREQLYTWQQNLDHCLVSLQSLAQHH